VATSTKQGAAIADEAASAQSSDEGRSDTEGRSTSRWFSWRRIALPILCLALYTFLTGILFGGVGALDSVTMTGPRTADQIVQIWWLAWDHFSIAHGHSPFFSDWQNYPVGMNFGLNGSVLALGIPFSPLTGAFGPIVTWNVLMQLSVVASAFSMCLCLRRWVRWWPAAFVGGLLYGFSTYVLFNADDYLFLAFVPLPPVVLLLFDEIVARQRWKPVVVGVTLGLVLGVQYLVSSEILASTVLMAVIASAVYLVHERKRFATKIRYMAIAGASALGAGIVSLGYPLYFTFLGPQHANGPPNSVAALAQLHGDLLGPLVPGPTQRLHSASFASLYQALALSNAMYLGVPLLIAIALTVYLLRSRGIVLLTGIMTAVSLVLSLGSTLYVAGHDTHVPLPFAVLTFFPIANGLLSTRLALFTILFGAAVIAFGTEELHRRLAGAASSGVLPARWKTAIATVVPLLIVALLALPTLPARTQARSPTNAAQVFTSSALSSVRVGSVLLGYPYPNPPRIPTGPGGSFRFTLAPVEELLLNQAVSGMRFKIVGGYGWRPTKGYNGTTLPSRLIPRSVQTFFEVAFFGVATTGQTKVLKSADLTTDLRTFVHRYHVQTIVVLPIGAHPEAVVDRLTAALGAPSRIHGAAAWLGLQSDTRSTGTH
jgi:hypothetical protein